MLVRVLSSLNLAGRFELCQMQCHFASIGQPIEALLLGDVNWEF